MELDKLNLKKVMWVLSVASFIGILFICIDLGFGILASIFLALLGIPSAVITSYMILGIVVVTLSLIRAIKPLLSWFFK